MSKTTPKTAPKAKAFRKANDTRELRIAKQASAREAIGPITPGQDVRDMKGSIIPHPAIAVEAAAQKLAAGLLEKWAR